MLQLKNLNLSEDIKKRIEEWLSDDYDEDTRNEIQNLIKDNNIKELEDRFYKELEFGTGGLRGVMGAGSNRMNKYNVWKATQGLANYLKKNFNNLNEIKVAIAYDSRNNSSLFAKETALVLAGNNIKVYLFDSLRPTPMLSFTVRHLKAQAGIVITASHNPPEYNGYKVYWEDGAQIVPPHDKNIINEVKSISSIKEILRINEEEANEKKLIEIIGEEIDEVYLEKVKSLSINPEIIKKVADELKIVYTPIHGSGNIPVRKSLKKYGFNNVTVVKEQEKPDGNFPTVEYPNPEEPEALRLGVELCKKINADFLIGTDPDCDRMGVAVKNNNDYILLNGNQIASLMAYYILSQLKEKNKLPENGMLVKTIVTTDLLSDIAKDFNVEVIETLTGFKYIGEQIKIQEELKKEGKEYKEYIFGGEESYGTLAGTFVRDKDAVIASSLFSEMNAYLKYKNIPILSYLDEIYKKYGYYKEALKSITMKGADGHKKIENIMKTFREHTPDKIGEYKVIKVGDILKGELFNKETNQIEKKYDLPTSNVIILFLENNIKITMRPSGTEPKIKFYFAISNKQIKDIKNDKINTDKILEEVITDFLQLINNI